MEVVKYEDNEIYYSLTRKRIRNIYARMDKDGNLSVSAPYLISKSSIEKFVIEAYLKLSKRVSKKNKSIVNNGKIRILNELYDSETIDNLNFLLTIKLKEYVRNNYLDICREMGIINPPKVVLKRVKGYLGEYNKKSHTINLNILIAHLEEDCVKYVIVHELAHVRYQNHQEAFWLEVEKYLPNYKKLRNKSKKEFVYYENY